MQLNIYFLNKSVKACVRIVCILRCLYHFFPLFHIFQYVEDLFFHFVSCTCISSVLLVDGIQRNDRFALILRLVSLCYFCQV